MDHAPYRDATKTRRQKLLDSEGDPGNGTRKVPHLAVKPNGNHWSLREGAGEYKRAADAIWILKRRAVCSVLCMSKAKATLPSFLPSFPTSLPSLSSEIVPDFAEAAGRGE